MPDISPLTRVLTSRAKFSAARTGKSDNAAVVFALRWRIGFFRRGDHSVRTLLNDRFWAGVGLKRQSSHFRLPEEVQAEWFR